MLNANQKVVRLCMSPLYSLSTYLFLEDNVLKCTKGLYCSHLMEDRHWNLISFFLCYVLSMG